MREQEKIKGTSLLGPQEKIKIKGKRGGYFQMKGKGRAEEENGESREGRQGGKTNTTRRADEASREARCS